MRNRLAALAHGLGLGQRREPQRHQQLKGGDLGLMLLGGVEGHSFALRMLGRLVKFDAGCVRALTERCTRGFENGHKFGVIVLLAYPSLSDTR